jgi:signal transduction histidine kinase
MAFGPAQTRHSDRRSRRRGEAATYVGPDRRERPPQHVSASPVRLVVLVALPAVVGIALSAVLMTTASSARADLAQSAVLLGLATATAGCAGAITFLLHRITGRTTDLWLAIGFALLALCLVVDAAGSTLGSAEAARWDELATALCVGFVAFGAMAVVGPEIDTRSGSSGLRRLTTLALGMVCAGLLVGVTDVGTRGGATPFVVTWAAVGAAAAARWRRRFDGHSVLAFGGFALTGVVIGVDSASAAGLWPAAHVAIVMVGASVIAVGYHDLCAFSETRDHEDFSRRLLDAAGRESVVVAHAQQQERDHDLSSSLLAIAAAMQNLAADAAQDAVAVQRIASTVASESERLRRMLSGRAAGGSAPAPSSSCDVGAVLAPLLLLERSRGARVCAHVPRGVTVGVPPDVVVRIVRTLLDNARTHAPGSSVELTTRWLGARIEIEVRDVADHHAARRADPPQDDPRSGSELHGLGLLSAQRLAAVHGGSLRAVRHATGLAVTVDLPSGAQVITLDTLVPDLAQA